MRLAPFIAAVFAIVTVAVIVLPTAGGGLETSLAFQRTDVAAAILAITSASLALATVGFHLAGLIIGIIGLAVAFWGLSLTAGNPRIGALANIYLFAGPALAVGYVLLRRLADIPVQLSRKPVAVRAPAVKADSTPKLGSKDDDKAESNEQVEAEADIPAKPKIPKPILAAEPSAPIQPEREPKVTLEAPESSDPVVTEDNPTPKGPRPLPAEDDEDEKNRLDFLRIRAEETEDPEASIERWQALRETYPDYYPALVAEARLLHQLGRLGEARARLNDAYNIVPDDAATLALSARYAAQDNDFESAEIYWRQAFAAHDMNEGAAASYINALVQQKKFDEANTLFHHFRDQWPDRARIIRSGAAIAETVGDYGEAHSLWQTAMQLEPGVYSDSRRSIAALIALEDLPSAANEIREYLQDAPDDPEPKALAKRLVRLASAQDSAEGLEVLSTLGVREAKHWSAFVEARLAAGDIVSAESAFQRATERNISSPELLRAGGLIALRAKRRDLEAERWSALVELTPDDLGAVRRAAVAYSGLGELGKAYSFVESGLDHQPDHGLLLTLKANLAERLGRWEDALSAWKTYGAHHGLSPLVLSQTARALRRLERFDEAAAIVEAGLRETPNAPELLKEQARFYDQAVEHMDKDAPDAAATREKRLDAWKNVVRNMTNEPVAWLGLIAALIDDGKPDSAKAALGHALTAVPDPSVLLTHPQIIPIAEGAS